MTDPAPFPLASDLLRAIVDHARREAPRECCGVLIGSGGRAEAIVPMTNIAPGTMLYEIDPVQLLDLEFRTLPASGQEIVAVYHSHPASAAWPSATDIALAQWPDACYLICSLAEPSAPDTRAFGIVDGVVRERRLVEP